MQRAYIGFPAAVWIALLASRSPAAVITGVSIHDVSSQLTTSFQRGAIHTIDGSGLNINGPGTHSNVPDGTMWLDAGNGCCGDAADTNPQITWDLGAVYDVDSMRIWNYNENSGNPGVYTLRGIDTTDVYVSSNGVDYTKLGNITLNQAPGSATVDFSQIVPVNATARYVRFTNITDFPGADNDFVGLSEIQFNSVPEPASLGLLAIGAMGLLARRRLHR